MYIKHFYAPKTTPELTAAIEAGNNIFLNENLTVMTCISADKQELITQQLSQMQPKQVLKYDGKKYGRWYNRLKLPMFLKALNDCTTEYALLVDALDVAFVPHTQGNIIDAFNAQDCDILFSSSIEYPCPFAPLNLNAGVIIGKTDKLRDFYQYISDNGSSLYNRVHTASVGHILKEQPFIRLAYNEYTGAVMKIDTEGVITEIRHSPLPLVS